MNFRIVADSSSDVLSLDRVEFASAPLKILTSKKEYTDNADLDVKGMAEDMKSLSEASKTSCPSVGDWLDAFGDADFVFCCTITSHLSGSYNSACVAAEEYMSEHPERKAYVIDSLSTGPEMGLIIEKLEQGIVDGKDFETLCTEIEQYKKTTGLLFVLESLRNLANNGRVKKTVARLAGVLGIRLVGRASIDGELEPLDKIRGEKRALEGVYSRMKQEGFAGGRVKIGHCNNEIAAKTVRSHILAEFPKCDIEIYHLRGLCSFYAEMGGILIGFEKN